MGRKEISTSRSVSPKVLSENANSSSTTIAASASPLKQQQQPVPRHNFMTERSTKLIDEQQFSENLSEFLSDNPDFFVVGVVGPQGVGKSTLMNALANGLIEPRAPKDESSTNNGAGLSSNFFRVQSFEKQMTGEHCTNGASAWISPKHRIILVDSQATNSPSILDRTIQVQRKVSYM